MLEVKNTSPTDLKTIHALFDHSVIYQEKHGYPDWRNYDKHAILKDIEDGNQYKVMVDSRIGIVFSVCYSDKIIWRDREKGDSMYLHRIVVNPEFKGKRLFGEILNWSIEHCNQRALKNIRMDTWAENPTIVNYYKTFGFTVIEDYTTPETEELPVHNRNLPLTLLELKISDVK
jgi:ribosomal protein S18 acetylase RimI-like enzyme